MITRRYLLDTHALLFWANGDFISAEFLQFLDDQDAKSALYVSSISFWEIAFLVQKEKIEIPDLYLWKDELLARTNLNLIDPTATEMIDSTQLPLHHKDPFDRLLIAQANGSKLILITKDQEIAKYPVDCYWE